MDRHANDTRPCAHDWTPSPWEAGVEVCAWAGCKETREAAPSEESASVVVVVLEERRAA